MTSFFRELFEYNHHFNQRLSDVFMENREQVSEKSVKVFSHILNAHQIWNNRIVSEEPLFEVWKIHAIENFKNIDQKNHKTSLQLLENIDLDELISYTNSKGIVFKNAVRDILFHITNHSTYHRGQVAIEFRQKNIDPLVTDYIFYKR